MSDTNSLTRAALVMHALSQQEAARIITRLQPADIKTLREAVDALKASDLAAQQAATSKLWEEVQLLRRKEGRPVLSIRGQQNKEADSVPAGRNPHPFDFLLELGPSIRCKLLADEHPKHIAIVMSTMPPQVASATMEGFADDNLRISILKRLCELDDVDDAEMGQLRYGLKLRLQRWKHARDTQLAGVTRAAELLSCAPGPERDSLLARVQQFDPDLGDKLQRSVIDLETLVALSANDLKTLLKHVDTSLWAPALQNASDELRQNVMQAMAPPASLILWQEIQELGPVDRAQQHQAQRTIITKLLDLTRDGKIELREKQDAA